MVFRNSASSCVVGFHLSVDFANEISGRRCFGSSLGSGFFTIFDFDPVSSITFSASCRMVNSRGLPRRA